MSESKLCTCGCGTPLSILSAEEAKRRNSHHKIGEPTSKYIKGHAPKPKGSPKRLTPEELRNRATARKKIYWKRYPEKRRVIKRKMMAKRRIEHPEFIERDNAKARAKRLENPEETRRKERDQYLKSIGWSLEKYNAAKESQEGCCAICGDIPIKDPKGGRPGLCADHDHTTGTSRALLCTRCNSGIGQFRDDPERLKAAIQYLYKWQNLHT